MIVYNVTIKTTWRIAADWMQWMQQEHIPEVLATGLFTQANLFRLLEVDDEDGPTYVTQYSCHSLNEYQQYIQKHSALLREKGVKKWGGEMIAFRTVLEKLPI